jgi:hypothetical protein
MALCAWGPCAGRIYEIRKARRAEEMGRGLDLRTAPDLPDQPQAKDVLRDLTGRERRHFGKGVVNQKLHLERPVSRDFTLSGCKAIFLHPIARFDLSFATKMAKTNFISAFPYLPQGVSGPCGRNFLADSAA